MKNALANIATVVALLGTLAGAVTLSFHLIFWVAFTLNSIGTYPATPSQTGAGAIAALGCVPLGLVVTILIVGAFTKLTEKNA